MRILNTNKPVPGAKKYTELETVNPKLKYKLIKKYKRVNLYKVYISNRFLYLESFKLVSGKDIFNN